eukprot:7938833-Pyramimonas_sp.AAC.1
MIVRGLDGLALILEGRFETGSRGSGVMRAVPRPALLRSASGFCRSPRTTSRRWSSSSGRSRTP